MRQLDMWTPVDTQFFGPKTPVAIACVYNQQTAQVLRQTLEGLSAMTLLHVIGTPGDFLQVIGQTDSAPPYLVITGHGEDDGIEFGDDFMDGIDTSMLVDGMLPAAAIAAHVKLTGCTIVNTACDGGNEAVANAFLAGGAAAYIGTAPNPNACEHTLFIAHFFHAIIRRHQSPLAAWQKAVAHDDHRRYYRFFDQTGQHTASN